MDNRSEVRQFLATRRAKIAPDQVGVPLFGGKRRVPGLRREEVALLAGVSVDYYTRMEKGNLTADTADALHLVASWAATDQPHHADTGHTAQPPNPQHTVRRTAAVRGPCQPSRRRCWCRDPRGAVTAGVVRPGPVHLLEHVATARARARVETWMRVEHLLTRRLRQDPDGLLVVDPLLGWTRLAWSGTGPTSSSPAAAKAELDHALAERARSGEDRQGLLDEILAIVLDLGIGDEQVGTRLRSGVGLERMRAAGPCAGSACPGITGTWR